MTNHQTFVSPVSPVNVVFKVVMRRVRDDAAEADGEREETLCHGGIPDSWLQKLRPFWCDEVEDPVNRAIQSNRANQ